MCNNKSVKIKDLEDRKIWTKIDTIGWLKVKPILRNCKFVLRYKKIFSSQIGLPVNVPLYIMLNNSWDVQLFIHNEEEEFWLMWSEFPYEIIYKRLECIYICFGIHFECICNTIPIAFGMHFDCIWNPFWFHLECILNESGLHFECIWNTFWIHSECILKRFGMHMKRATQNICSRERLWACGHVSTLSFLTSSMSQILARKKSGSLKCEA